MNYDALLQLLRTRPTVERWLDAIIAGAEDGRTTVDDILIDGEVPRRQVINLLRDLENLGYGAFKVGRKGHPSRFEWSIDPAELEAVLDGDGREPDSESSDAEVGRESSEHDATVGDDDESGRPCVLFMQANQARLDRGESVRPPKRHARGDIDHAFVLRPDCRVSLALPDNLTRREAEVLADWVRNLSFER